MVKYAVIKFSTTADYKGIRLSSFDWGQLIAEKSHFLNIQEAEKCRQDLLKLCPEMNPQNLQVIQYDTDQTKGL